MKRSLLLVLLLAGVLAVMPSCLGATQVSVKITTDLACPGLRSHLHVGLPDTIDSALAQSTSLPDGCKAEGNPNYIGTTVITPGASDIVTVRVAAAEPGTDPAECPLRGKVGCVVAQRTIKFVSHSSLVLPIRLDSACKDKVCAEGETCKAGVCVPIDNTPANCDPVTGICDEPPVDAGVKDAPPVRSFYIAGVAAGGNATCALLHETDINGEHQLVCWGSNAALGAGARKPQRVVLGAKDVEDVAIGDNHMCSLETSGRVECTGENKETQCGATDCTKPVEVTPSAAASISAAGNHTCYLDDQGALYCWGSNQYKEINETSTTAQTPSKVTSMSFSLLAVGAEHICGQSQTKTLCWGNNPDARCGVYGPPNVLQSSPGKVSRSGGGDVAPSGDHFSLAVGRFHGSVVSSTPGPSIWSWGNNAAGQVNGMPASPTFSYLAVQLTPLNAAPVSLALGQAHSCVLTKPGGVYCWGDPTVTGCPKAQGCDIALPGTATDLASGANHTCALVRMGGSTTQLEVYCWGASGVGQAGTVLSNNTPPVKVDLSSFFAQ